MDKIVLLHDYKGHFGSRHDAFPYRSGMDKERLKELFHGWGFDIEFLPMHLVSISGRDWKGVNVLYTSSEDKGLIYKQYIEDIVFALSQCGANVIPRFEYLRANNNKVFMELLRESFPPDIRGNLDSRHFGCLEEAVMADKQVDFPVVVKGYAGAMGRNVFLAADAEELKKIVRKKISSGTTLWFRIKEYLRQIKHKGYKRDSFHRGKFIVQKFIPGLSNDWKVYYFGEKAFVFRRPVFPERVFRASGGGYENYRYGTQADIPGGLLDFGWRIFQHLGVPNASLDIAWDGNRFYLLEFQCVYFGTAGILREFSSEYFTETENSWMQTLNYGDIEKVYAESIVWFLKGDR